MAALIETPEADLRRFGPPPLAEAILAVGAGRVVVEPGYDGVYGVTRVSGAPRARAAPRPPSRTTPFPRSPGRGWAPGPPRAAPEPEWGFGSAGEGEQRSGDAAARPATRRQAGKQGRRRV